MAQEQKKRARRIPLTREEVAAVLAFKQRKEQLQLLKLKRSFSYKLLNVFNIICFFVFCEILFCYFGPGHYRFHYTKQVLAKHGLEHKPDGTAILEEVDLTCVEHKPDGTAILEEVDLTCVEGHQYKVLVNEYRDVPNQFTVIEVGQDFLLRRDLKASFDWSDKEYRIFSASPVLFLATFSSIILLIGIMYNLNENEYTLWGLSMICGMTLLCVIFM